MLAARSSSRVHGEEEEEDACHNLFQCNLKVQLDVHYSPLLYAQRQPVSPRLVRGCVLVTAAPEGCTSFNQPAIYPTIQRWWTRDSVFVSRKPPRITRQSDTQEGSFNNCCCDYLPSLPQQHKKAPYSSGPPDVVVSLPTQPLSRLETKRRIFAYQLSHTK